MQSPDEQLTPAGSLTWKDDAAAETLGPRVLIVRRLRSGKTEHESLPAFLAVDDILNNPRNGGEVVSAHIEWFDVLDEWSRSP